MWPSTFPWECSSEEGPCGTLTYLQALDNGWWKSGSIMANNLLHRGLLAMHSGRPRALCSAPAHADGCLLTLGADAKASAHEYNVILRPWGPGGLAGGQQTGPTRGRCPACVPSLRIYELNLLYFINSVGTWAHLRMMKADWYNPRGRLNYYIKTFYIFHQSGSGLLLCFIFPSDLQNYCSLSPHVNPSLLRWASYSENEMDPFHPSERHRHHWHTFNSLFPVYHSAIRFVTRDDFTTQNRIALYFFKSTAC